MNGLLAPAPPAPSAPTTRVYASPQMVPLGAVDAVTAGPDGGTLDQLVGSSGGFMEDGTS